MNPEADLPEWYWELHEEYLGAEATAWARLPPEQRRQEMEWYHANFNTPDDLSVWPPELGGDENARE